MAMATQAPTRPSVPPGVVSGDTGDTGPRRTTAGRAPATRGPADELSEMQQAATVALTVLRRALVEGAAVTREAITHEAAIVFATDPAEAAARLDSQAEGLGVSSLM